MRRALKKTTKRFLNDTSHIHKIDTSRKINLPKEQQVEHWEECLKKQGLVEPAINNKKNNNNKNPSWHKNIPSYIVITWCIYNIAKYVYKKVDYFFKLFKEKVNNF